MAVLSRLLGIRLRTEGLSVEEVRLPHQHGALLIDGRQADERAAGHAAGARHVSLGRAQRLAATPPRDGDLLMLGRSDNRGAGAHAAPHRAGYRPTVNCPAA